jgi:hypothetical protein
MFGVTDPSKVFTEARIAPESDGFYVPLELARETIISVELVHDDRKFIRGKVLGIARNNWHGEDIATLVFNNEVVPATQSDNLVSREHIRNTVPGGSGLHLPVCEQNQVFVPEPTLSHID